MLHLSVETINTLHCLIMESCCPALLLTHIKTQAVLAIWTSQALLTKDQVSCLLIACSELRASKVALSPMTRQVAEAAHQQEALRQAQQEAAACKQHLHALEQAHAAQQHTVDEHRSECFRVSSPAHLGALLTTVTWPQHHAFATK